MIHFDSERCMEDFFFENHPHYSEHFGTEYLPNLKAHRQVALGKYGICDLLFLSSIRDEIEGKLNVSVRLVELKNTALSHSDVAQVARYKSFFDELAKKAKGLEINFFASLVGLKTFPGAGDLCYLCQGIDWLDVYQAEISACDGVILSRVSGWGPAASTEESFKNFVCNYVLPLARADGAQNGKS